MSARDRVRDNGRAMPRQSREALVSSLFHAQARRGGGLAAALRAVQVVALVQVLLLDGAGATGAIAPAVRVVPGFRVRTFASGLSHPTAMAYGPDGRIYVTQTEGTVVAVKGGTTRPAVVLRGLHTPLGLAWRGRTLFVSEQGRIERTVLSRRGRFSPRHVLLSRLPYGQHQQDNVVVSRSGWLYVGSGSTCDACQERDRRSAAILSLRPDGTHFRVFATGLRNPFGLAVQPESGHLYATVNGQDNLGSRRDPEPADVLVRVRRGAWYGWPRCWPDARHLTMRGRCRGVTPPAAFLEPHSSADGLTFYRGTAFPRSYRGNIFVAEWGQYYSARFGRRVVRVVLGRDGRARRITTFASGFEHPLALLVDKRGALLVADWGRGVVYRIESRSNRSTRDALQMGDRQG